MEQPHLEEPHAAHDVKNHASLLQRAKVHLRRGSGKLEQADREPLLDTGNSGTPAPEPVVRNHDSLPSDVECESVMQDAREDCESMLSGARPGSIETKKTDKRAVPESPGSRASTAPSSYHELSAAAASIRSRASSEHQALSATHDKAASINSQAASVHSGQERAASVRSKALSAPRSVKSATVPMEAEKVPADVPSREVTMAPAAAPLAAPTPAKLNTALTTTSRDGKPRSPTAILSPGQVQSQVKDKPMTVARGRTIGCYRISCRRKKPTVGPALPPIHEHNVRGLQTSATAEKDALRDRIAQYEALLRVVTTSVDACLIKCRETAHCGQIVV
jgi:hypothetical protein